MKSERRANRSKKTVSSAGRRIARPRSGAPMPTAVVCRCEEVTEEEVRDVIRRGYHSLEEIKRILRCGMGHCQGRSCMTIIARMLAQETGTPVSAMQFPRSRPPLKPVPLEILSHMTELAGDSAPSKSESRSPNDESSAKPE